MKQAIRHFRMNSVGAWMASQMARKRDEFLDGPFAPRQGRNEPCLCGSGKKYKKCCIRRSMRDVLVSKREGEGR